MNVTRCLVMTALIITAASVLGAIPIAKFIGPIVALINLAPNHFLGKIGLNEVPDAEGIFFTGIVIFLEVLIALRMVPNRGWIHGMCVFFGFLSGLAIGFQNFIYAMVALFISAAISVFIQVQLNPDS